MEIHDVPAFQVEDYMPPEGELDYRVDFIYYPYALMMTPSCSFTVRPPRTRMGL